MSASRCCGEIQRAARSTCVIEIAKTGSILVLPTELGWTTSVFVVTFVKLSVSLSSMYAATSQLSPDK